MLPTPENHPVHFLNQCGFQRLYLEYYAFLYDLDATAITKVYQQGLGYNLKTAHFNLDVLRYVKNEIVQVSQSIEKQKDNCKSRLQAYLYEPPLLTAPESAHQQHSVKGKITRNQHLSHMQECLVTYLDTTPHAAALAELIKDHDTYLESHDSDIFARFNLAWIYFHLEENYTRAKEHLTQVIDKSLLNDNPLTQMALRYLAMSDYLLDDRTAAITSLQRAASLDQTNNLHFLYEIAQQLVQQENGENSKKEAAISHLKALIKHSPLYFVHIQSDPFFANNPEVDALLSRFHTAKLEEIKETTYRKWLASDIMQQVLPQEFNQQSLFNTSYEEHLTLLTYQPYPLLCKTDKISDKFLRNLQIKTRNKLTALNQQLTQSMHAEQTRWKVINLIGVGLIYIAVLLTLASIFLFIGGDLIGLTSAEESIDWGSLVPKLFASVLGTGITGILLLQFDPPRLKQLAKKKNMLNRAID